MGIFYSVLDLFSMGILYSVLEFFQSVVAKLFRYEREEDQDIEMGFAEPQNASSSASSSHSSTPPPHTSLSLSLSPSPSPTPSLSPSSTPLSPSPWPSPSPSPSPFPSPSASPSSSPIDLPLWARESLPVDPAETLQRMEAMDSCAQRHTTIHESWMYRPFGSAYLPDHYELLGALRGVDFREKSNSFAHEYGRLHGSNETAGCIFRRISVQYTRALQLVAQLLEELDKVEKEAVEKFSKGDSSKDGSPSSEDDSSRDDW
ncbi:uncharacterized protein EI97DRAFT_503152 [Westerdykella ornata]|uniref:Uncharacterized protein n=1 Tax=Westerdykella ornata TaxID=318751 RepID=A0A6A6JBT0_WESOR|nr:uncharacterized protein EI97DRAFT_503152 [Westerdykella ornata]KAF2273745.1 hypothetical protein EI97DRAFT_503152 [Westerdykella ornata]